MRFTNLGRYRTGGTSSNMQLGIPLPKTPNGRVYRYSPNEHAHPRHFVLGDPTPDFVITDDARVRMRQEPRSKQTICPYSGTVADDDEFTHPDDKQAALKIVEHAAISDVEAELARMFGSLNRSQSRNSMIRIETKVRQTPRPTPRFSREDLLRDLVCDHCGRDYGVYAIGLFCPDCGAPNLRLHFAREADLVRRQVDLADAQTEANHELAYRLLGNAHEDVLTACEATLKTVYLYGVTRQATDGVAWKLVKNDFQNVEFAQKRFAELSIDPFSCLNAEELATLKLNIQKRHIIGHNLGVMDEKFAEHAEDARLGETVHLVGEEVRLFAELGQRVVNELDSWLGGRPAPLPLAPSTGSAGPPAREPDERKTIVATSRIEDLGLEPLAARLALWIAKHSESGLDEDFVSEKDLLAEFVDVPERALEDAVAELETDGFIGTAFSGGAIPHIRPTVDLFANFDPEVMGHDPTRDAAELAKLVLEGQEDVDVPDLHKECGWPKRRFNPAVALVVAQIDDDHVSKTLGSEYPTWSFHVSAKDRVALRRFASRIEGR
jgi:hypothetical protein